jgi:CubicO group peptidase (beta-lactamase class C family)
MRILLLSLCSMSIALCAGRSAVAGVLPVEQLPADRKIRRVLKERVDFYGRGVGLVVGVVGPSGKRTISYGLAEKASGRLMSGETLVDLASVSKVFTALLLAEMAGHGEVELTDPVARYLPPEMQPPDQPNDRAITLLELATYTSGLPRDAPNLAPVDPQNPYADYTPESLGAFLASFKSVHPPGSRYGYSNLGFGVLGYALARRAGVDFPDLLSSRIFKVLGLTDTRIVTGAGPPRLAQGYDADLAPVPHWDHSPVLMGSGAVSSTANDLLNFLEALLGYRASRLSPAMGDLLKHRRPTDSADTLVSLGWGILQRNGREIVWKSGGGGGFSTWIGYDLERRTGVVVLANSTATAPSDIGFHILDPSYPLAKMRRQVAVEPRRLEAYAGRYQLADRTVAFVRDGDHLLFRDATVSFLRTFPLEFTFDFESEDDARPKRVVFYQNGEVEAAERLGD